MKTTTLALVATLLATPLAAQSLRNCDTFEANAVVSRRRSVENVTRFLGLDGA